MFLVVLNDNTEIEVGSDSIMPEVENEWDFDIYPDNNTFRIVNEINNDVFACHYSDVKYVVKK